MRRRSGKTVVVRDPATIQEGFGLLVESWLRRDQRLNPESMIFIYSLYEVPESVHYNFEKIMRFVVHHDVYKFHYFVEEFFNFYYANYKPGQHTLAFQK